MSDSGNVRIGDLRGEMVLTDLGYRTGSLRRGQSGQILRNVIRDSNSRDRVAIPATGAEYSQQSLGDRFRVVLSTGDQQSIDVLGTSGSNRGETRTGFQAVILQNVQTDEYYLSVAGVAGDAEFNRTRRLVDTLGFHAEWAFDLVKFVELATILENQSKTIRFDQAYTHSGGFSAIFGADLWLFDRQGGNKHARLELCIRFEEGRGVERDLGKAKKLYRLAASDSGGRIWVYSPPVGNGTKGRVIPVDAGPKRVGLKAAKVRLAGVE